MKKWNWKKILGYGSAFFAGFLVVLLIGIHLYTQFSLYPQLEATQEETKRYEEMLLTDFKQIEKAPLFKKNDYKNDATSYLAKYIPLVGNKAKKLDSKQNQMIEKIFEHNTAWVNDKKAFNNIISDPNFANLDPKWLEKLMPFDYWAYSNLPEIQALTQSISHMDGVQKINIYTTLPIPNYNLLKN